jgi:hypothetical protein
MAKKDNKKSKKGKRANDPSEVVEAVRERGKGLLEEVSSAAQRIRDSFDDVRVADDIRAMRAELEALAKRVAALEQGSTGAPARAAAGAARRATAPKPGRVTAPPPPKPAAADGKAKPGAAATRTRSTATASASAKDSGGAGKRPAAAKRSTAARKPAGS